MIKISLVINSKDPNMEWLNQCLDSAKGFDEVILYLDAREVNHIVRQERPEIKFVSDGQSRNIAQGLNYAIKQSSGDWICAFCDDDYFLTDNLSELIKFIKSGFCNTSDVVHFQASLSNGGLWGENEVTAEKLYRNNILPFSSFFTREIFDRVKGFNEQVGAYNDWNFWLRVARAGAKFKYFDKPVYFFRQGHESATTRLLNEVGGHCNAIREVLNNA